MRWIRHGASGEEMRNVFKILEGKPEGKRPLDRHGHRWSRSVKINIK
jgi:hypothetical protein